jgi:hypothetical protein
MFLCACALGTLEAIHDLPGLPADPKPFNRFNFEKNWKSLRTWSVSSLEILRGLFKCRLTCSYLSEAASRGL